MGSNRKQPFGYTMEFGHIVIHQEEAKWVMKIFLKYNQGASFKELAEMMQNTSIAYDMDKPWNKNMVARILGDSRYTGKGDFPTIIGQDTFQRAAEKRSKKTTPTQRSEAQKILRKKCGCRPTKYVEGEVLCILNRLIADPEIITTPKTPITQNQRLDILRSELNDMIQQLPVDETATRKKIMEVAVAMYGEIDPREYETYRLKKVFQKVQPRTELDADLIAMSISAVYIESSGNIKIKLRNEQIIERGEEQ